jgi:signal transduction histidine kinase
MGDRAGNGTPIGAATVAGTVAPNVSGLDAAPLIRRKSAASISWKLWVVTGWLVFSVALAIWWLIFGLQQSARLTDLARTASASVSAEIANEVARQHRMLMSEGVTLIILLLCGGAALLWSIGTDLKRARRIQEFLAAFTHDLKTSLSSLRLQTEALEEDLKDSGQSRLAKRLVKDTVRLELQLENSLSLAAPESESPLLIENIELSDLLSMLSTYWPDLLVAIEGESIVYADRRALESIFKNLAQNAVVHGRASKIQIDIQRQGPWTNVRFADDGRGFRGNFSRLGRMFERHSSTSGSGLGLSLAMQLSSRMGGGLTIIEAQNGFSVEILLPSSLEEET